jgi:hypothetical protein
MILDSVNWKSHHWVHDSLNYGINNSKRQIYVRMDGDDISFLQIDLLNKFLFGSILR